MQKGDHSGLMERGKEKQVNRNGEVAEILPEGMLRHHAEDAARSLTDE